MRAWCAPAAVHRPKPACAASRGRSRSCSAPRLAARQPATCPQLAAQQGDTEPRRQRPAGPAECGGRVPGAGAGHAGPGPRPHAGVPGPRLRPPVPAAHALGAGSRARGRPAGAARLRHHARDGALAGAVDGVRRHRTGGRPQEPRQPLAARQGRSQGRRRRPAAGLRSLQAGRSRIRRAVADAPGQSGAAAGTASGCARARRPGRCR